MANEYDDSTYYEELYLQFRNYLEGDKSLTFSEDDLADIFDYAGDNADDYVQTEVLFLGRVLFPKSRRLAERKALLYLDSGNLEGALSVAAGLPQTSLIGELLKLKKIPAGSEEFLKRRTAVLTLRRPGRMDDEESIRFVRLLSDMGQFDWMLENIEAIKKLAEYPTTIEYELAIELAESGKYEQARELAQALTEAEPFNINFWGFLANICSDYLGDYDMALQAIDYALAIDPTSRKELLLKTQTLMRKGASFEKVDAALQKLLRSNPIDYDLALYHASVLNEFGRNREALDVLKSCMDIADHNIKEYMILSIECNGGELPGWLDMERFVSMLEVSELNDLTRYLYLQKSFDAAAKVITAYFGPAQTMKVPDFALYLEVLFRMEHYKEVVSLFEERYPDPLDSLAMPSLITLYVFARRKLGDNQELASLIERTLKSEVFAPALPNLESRMLHNGFGLALYTLHDRLVENPPKYPDIELFD